MTRRPRSKELANMSSWELLDNVVWDPSNAGRYREHLYRRMAEKGTKSIRGLFEPAHEEEKVVFLPAHKVIPSQVDSRYRQVVLDVIENRRAYNYAADACLKSGWNFVDPIGKMQKTPEQVVDFLTMLTQEVGMYGDLFSSRRNLFKMIMDAWLRWAQGNPTYEKAQI